MTASQPPLGLGLGMTTFCKESGQGMSRIDNQVDNPNKKYLSILLSRLKIRQA